MKNCLQSHNKKNGLPWGFSKSFDGSAAVSKLLSADKIKDFDCINFFLEIKTKSILRLSGLLIIFS